MLPILLADAMLMYSANPFDPWARTLVPNNPPVINPFRFQSPLSSLTLSGVLPSPSLPSALEHHPLALGLHASPAMLASQRLLAAPPPQLEIQHEMTIANDIIGCVIGRGGAKINEIRRVRFESIWLMHTGLTHR